MKMKVGRNTHLQPPIYPEFSEHLPFNEVIHQSISYIFRYKYCDLLKKVSIEKMILKSLKNVFKAKGVE